MDTSNSFRVYDLKRSQFSEDLELVTKAREIMVALVTKLKPLLRHIAVPVPVVDYGPDECSKPNFHVVNPYGSYRAIKLFEIEGVDQGLEDTLFLDEGGGFFTAWQCRSSQPQKNHYHNQDKDVFTSREESWELAPFDKLIASLNEAFRQGEEKRQQYLQGIKERREMMDEILKIIHRHAS